jgi:hypothetical protein
MLGFYYFIDDCNDARLNIPKGMLSSGNTVFLSFVADDKWEEGKMTNHLDEVAKKIKELKPSMYVAYSIGGQVGSMSTALFSYLSSNSEETIANTILGWRYADGIDWDLEPPSGGAAGGYGKQAMAQKLGRISKLVQAGGKHVTMAGFGARAYSDSMATLNGELIISGAVEKYGLMVYAPSQVTASDVVKYMSYWEKGAQSGPSEVRNKGVQRATLAGGISGKAAVSQAVSIAQTYQKAGAPNVIVWMVKPDLCSDMGGWAADNSQLPQWSGILAAQRGDSFIV